MRLNLIRLSRLSRQEWQWLFASLILLPAIALSIKNSGWVKTMRRCRRVFGLGDVAPINPAEAARMVRVAATYGPFRAKCLPRAIVLWALLRRHCIDAELKLGVRKGECGFEAHAWVESGGLLLGEAPEVVPFATLRALRDPAFERVQVQL